MQTLTLLKSFIFCIQVLFIRLNTTMQHLLAILMILLGFVPIFSQDLVLELKDSQKRQNLNAYTFELSKQTLAQHRQSKPEDLNLSIRFPDKPEMRANLTRTTNFDETRFVNERGEQIGINPQIYTGLIEGKEQSLVSISLHENRAIGLISVDGQNWNMAIDPSDQSQLLFSDESLPFEAFAQCETKDPVLPSQQNLITEDHSVVKNNAMSPVDLYIEADYQLYTDFNSSTQDALDYVTSLLATVNILFNGANIDLQFPEIKIWTSMDPYDANSASSSGVVLDRLKCELDGNYNGRMAHLLSTVSQFGGIANRRGSCPYDRPLYAFSRVFTSFNTNLNVYSWSINVIAHEIGHNLSSHHTHNCQWNGNSTQIDDCGNTLSTSNNNDSNCNGIIDDVDESEGSDCFDIANPVLPAQGTIMSYCHAVSGVGVNLAAGFHPQVANKMKSFIDFCLSPTPVVHCPIVDTTEILISYPNPNTIEFTCTRTSDVDMYAWYYKRDASCTESTTITTSSPTLVVDNVFANRVYNVECVIRCASTLEWGDWSCTKKVITPDCDPTYLLSGIVSQEDLVRQALNSIQSDQLILSNATASYFSDNNIELLDGFQVDIGATFRATIVHCN